MAVLKYLAVPALVTCATVGAGSAATAPEIWAEWQETAAASGQTFAAEREDYSNGVLTLTGLSISAEFDEGSTRSSLSQIRLEEQGDGSVRILLDDESTIQSETTAEGETVSLDLMLSHDDLEIIASGTPDERLYTYDAAQMSVRLVEITMNGEDVPMDLEFAMKGLDADYTMAQDNPALLTANSAIDALGFILDAQDPEGSGSAMINYSAENVVATSKGGFGAFANTADPGSVFRASEQSQVRMSHNGSVYAFSFVGPDGTLSGAGTASSGNFEMDAGGGGIRYSVSGNGTTLRAEGSQMAVPVELSTEEFGADITIPMVANPEPQDVALKLVLNGLTLSETIWRQVDPGQGLPRSAANLLLDLAGKATLSENLYDIAPEQGTAPGELNALAINQLELEALGARLTGSGAFLIDNTVPGLAPMAPRAVGKLSLQAFGVNTLIQQLGQSGLVPNESLMGFQMMLGMIARPGTSPDSLVSDVELTESGGVLVNGMRMR